MKPSFIAVLSLLLPMASARAQEPFVRNGNSVICGNARFQFCTPSMGRFEYSPKGIFVDAPTVVVTNRDFPAVVLNVSQSNGWLSVATTEVTVRYHIGSGKFGGDNLELTWRDRKELRMWAPGQADSANLGGVTYSLDGIRENNPPHFPPGILSRDGYFILDDSNSPLWDKQTNWIAAREDSGNQDWYWMVYNHDYPKGLREYAQLAGKIPMVPRYTLGTWITDLNYEYLPGSELTEKYRYSDENVKGLVEKFRSAGIPLDVLVLDFAWHKFGWQGGFDWSPIVPHPAEFLQWAHRQGIKVSLNDHPGYANEGVLSMEDSHAARVVRDLGIVEPPKATYTIDISHRWKFRVDPNDEGMKEKWFSPRYDDTTWQEVEAGIVWEEQGHSDYDGFGWYRRWISCPNVQEGTPVILAFGGVDDEYDLFVNGRKIAHHGSRGSSVWNSLTSTDVTGILKRDSLNLITLRVNDWGGGGGISKLPAELTDRLPFQGIRFDLADKNQADVFMKELHDPLIDEGVDFWWIDGGKGACAMPGLDGQMWTNRVYYDYTQEHTGKRTFVFSRYGGLGNHRYPGIFTGDTYSEWAVLKYEVQYSAQAGNVLMPYVTHDIGGFLGRKIPFDLYARWIQFGVFNPIVRLHSAFENPKDGNLRMPWNYGPEGMRLVKKYFTLRYRLLPYLYTCTRIAHEKALPLNRPLYLVFPDLDEAYRHPDEYLFGDEFLCAPIVDSSGKRDVYLPPGTWYDFFTDKAMNGGVTIPTTHTLEDFPLFVKDGAIIPIANDMEYSDESSLDSLNVEIYGRKDAHYELYEDDGNSLEYEDGRYAWTPISSARSKSGSQEVEIGPTKGEFSGQPPRRAYTVVFHGFGRPRNVAIGGKAIAETDSGGDSWHWGKANGTLTIALAPRTIRESLRIVVRE